ncbi:hypothetical protein BDM02DRAFT_3123015 [Thelephora ganbajun]|uniref:Uncharacterized protein n=1 Tax=Thelephora ganbajun TaxID=370292 RepID=A0ACB6Z2Y1_THEGA|nr:hypothetical protein BDM02DRAFT_3123015 [Thelephora ganbajun]
MAGRTLLQLRLQNALHLKGQSLPYFYPSRCVCKLTNENSPLEEVAVARGGPPTLISYIGKVDLNDRFCIHSFAVTFSSRWVGSALCLSGQGMFPTCS